MKSVEVRGGQLTVVFGKSGERAVFDLGSNAEKWALKIRYPRGRIEKLGVKPASVVAVIGVDDPFLEAELDGRAASVSIGRARAGIGPRHRGDDSKLDLARLAQLRRRIAPNGAIWVVWPKGRKEFREDDIRAYGPSVGLVDVKVMAFSETLSGSEDGDPRGAARLRWRLEAR